MSTSRRSFLAARLAVPAAGEVPLRYRALGKTGLQVTSVGCGCAITPEPNVIERAADVGINFFDTARNYQKGNNERLVGVALKAKRKNVIISTKTEAKDKRGALEELDTSLRTLGFDYVDVWSLHARSKPGDITDELIEALDIAKKQGKARFTGVSTHDAPATVDRLIETKRDVMFVTYNFAMTNNHAAAEAIGKANAAGIGVVAMKPMAGGRAAGLKPGHKLYGMLEKEGALLAALKWVVKDSRIASAIPSMTDLDVLDENVKAMALPFTEADEKILAVFLACIGPTYCRMCNCCEGMCPKGLPVADVLRFLMYAENYGQFALGREHFLRLPEAARQVRCGECSQCAVKCANGVRVAERLARAQEWLA